MSKLNHESEILNRKNMGTLKAQTRSPERILIGGLKRWDEGRWDVLK